MDNPKVLVAIPYHSSKRYCLAKMFDAIESLTYQNKEIVMRVDPQEYGSENAVKNQREFFRKLALDKGFDYLYFMGCDTIPPADVIEQLLKQIEVSKILTPKKEIKIIGGVYWGRHNAENGDPGKAVAWIHEMSQEDQSELFNTPNRLVHVDGMGMDAVLIHREVLEKISWLDWFQNDDDYPFYDKAQELGYCVLIDTNVQCLHYFNADDYCYRADVVRKC